MSGAANPKTGLRPFLAEDAPVVAAIFRAAIEELTEDDYNPAQQEAWASVADDEKEFGEKLGKALTLIATFDGAPVGFASLENNTIVDMLYVHPAATGRGVAATLYDAIEKLATARGATELKVQASDTAREFFARRGFVAQQRSTLSVGNEWLGSTLMKKALAAKGAAS